MPLCQGFLSSEHPVRIFLTFENNEIIEVLGMLLITDESKSKDDISKFYLGSLRSIATTQSAAGGRLATHLVAARSFHAEHLISE